MGKRSKLAPTVPKEMTIFEMLLAKSGAKTLSGLARMLGVSRPTVRKWRTLGHVPEGYDHNVVMLAVGLSGLPEDILTARVRMPQSGSEK